LIWVKDRNKREKEMGPRKQIACSLSLLLLIVLILKTPRFADGHGRFNKFTTGSSSSSSSQFNQVKQHKVNHEFLSPQNKNNHHNAEEDGDDIFGVDKRKVHTGPNPLHNR